MGFLGFVSVFDLDFLFLGLCPLHIDRVSLVYSGNAHEDASGEVLNQGRDGQCNNCWHKTEENKIIFICLSYFMMTEYKRDSVRESPGAGGNCDLGVS